MILYTLVVLNSYILFRILAYQQQGGEILKIVALTATYFSMEYVVSSGLLFLFDVFEINIALVLSCALSLVFQYILSHRKKIGLEESVKFHVDYKLAVILLLLFPFVEDNFQLYGAGQDQGLYQAEAIEILMGNTEVQHDFEEYSLLETEEDRASYQSMVGATILGYYPVQGYSYPTLEYWDIASDVSGVYHGIQTFPALLALWGSLFGMIHMLEIQTLFYFCSVILLYHSLSLIVVSKLHIILATLIFAFSPLTIWTSRTSFTEMYLTLLVSAYVYFLIDERSQKWTLGLPLVAFAFFHVSYLTILPIFVLVHMVYAVRTKERQYLIANVLAALGLSGGYFMMSVIAPHYFFNNCSRLFTGNLITANNFMYWMYFASAVIIICSFAVFKYMYFFEKLTNKSWVGYLIPYSTFLFLSVILLHGVTIAFFRTPQDYTFRESLQQYYGQWFAAIEHTAFFGFLYATGFIIIPLIIYNLIKNYKWVMENPLRIAFSYFFIYLVLFQAAFVRKEIYYYFYYSRYLTFYLPIILAAWAVFTEKLNMKRCVILLSLVSVLCLVPGNYNLVQYRDMTEMEWEILVDLMETIEEESAIIAGTEDIRIIGMPLRTTTESGLFPIFDNPVTQLNLLANHYEHIYFLSMKDAGEKYLAQIPENILTEIVYKDTYEYSTILHNSLTSPFVTTAYPYPQQVTLFKISHPFCINSQYTFLPKIGTVIPHQIVVSGWNSFETEATWTTEDSKFSFQTDLKKDFILTFSYGKFQVDEESMIYFNDVKVADVSEDGGTMRVTLPKELFTDEVQTIRFVTPNATSPLLLGQSNDERTLGLNISLIQLSPPVMINDLCYVEFDIDKEIPAGIYISDWNTFETESTWTTEDSKLSFQTDLKEDFMLTFSYDKFQVYEESMIYFNDVKIADVTENGETMSVLLPKELFTDEVQTIRFVTPNATSPLLLGQSNDERTLGLNISLIQLSPPVMINDLCYVEFDIDKEIPAGIYISDWNTFETESIWTTEDSKLLFRTDLKEDFMLTFSYDKFQVYEESMIYFNGVKVADVVENGGSLTVELPKELLADEVQTIHFVTPNATSPLLLGQSTDGRMLGLNIKDITITPNK